MVEDVQRLQNSLLTSWIWKYWYHQGTGRICLLLYGGRPMDLRVKVDWVVNKKTGGSIAGPPGER